MANSDNDLLRDNAPPIGWIDCFLITANLCAQKVPMAKLGIESASRDKMEIEN